MENIVIYVDSKNGQGVKLFYDKDEAMKYSIAQGYEDNFVMFCKNEDSAITNIAADNVCDLFMKSFEENNYWKWNMITTEHSNGKVWVLRFFEKIFWKKCWQEETWYDNIEKLLKKALENAADMQDLVKKRAKKYLKIFEKSVDKEKTVW
jgi:hypothetical protein